MIKNKRTSYGLDKRFAQINEFEESGVFEIRMPLDFKLGKNEVKLKLLPNKLLKGSEVLIDIFDKNGNSIYYEISNIANEDESRSLIVFIYEDTVPGKCKIYINAILANNKTYQCQITSDVLTTVENTQEIKFGEEPKVKYTERTLQTQVFSTSTRHVDKNGTGDISIVSSIPPKQTERDNLSIEKKEVTTSKQTTSLSNNVGSGSSFEIPTFFSPSTITSRNFPFSSSMEGGTIFVNGISLEVPSNALSSTPFLNQSFSASILKVIGTGSIEVYPPFRKTIEYSTSNGLTSITFDRFFNHSNFTASYKELLTLASSGYSQSYAVFDLSNISPNAGVIDAVEVSYKSLNLVGSNYQPVGTFEVKGENLLIDSASVFFKNPEGIVETPIGNFRAGLSTFNTYWSTSSLGSNFPTASISSKIVDGIKIDYGTRSSTGSFTIIEPKNQYKVNIGGGNTQVNLSFDSFSESDLTGILPQLDVYISGSEIIPEPIQAAIQLSPIASSSFGTYIGSISQNFGKLRKNSFTFVAKKSGNILPKLISRVGKWHLGNIELKPVDEKGFNCNQTRIYAPMNLPTGSEVNFKIDYLNPDGRKTQTFSTIIEGVFFQGSRNQSVIPNGSVSGSDQLTGSFDTRYVLTSSYQTDSGSWNTRIDSLTNKTSSYFSTGSGADRQIAVYSGSNAVSGSNNLTFNGNILNLSGSQIITGSVKIIARGNGTGTAFEVSSSDYGIKTRILDNGTFIQTSGSVQIFQITNAGTGLNGTVAIGKSATATGTGTTALGTYASVQGSYSQAIGAEATVGNFVGSTAIGRYALVSANGTYGIGTYVSNTFANSFLIGNGESANSGDMLIGSSINSIGFGAFSRVPQFLLKGLVLSTAAWTSSGSTVTKIAHGLIAGEPLILKNGANVSFFYGHVVSVIDADNFVVNSAPSPASGSWWKTYNLNNIFNITNGTDGTLFATMNKLGYLALNKPSASYHLDVSGSGNFSNNLTVSGSLIANRVTGSFSGSFHGMPSSSAQIAALLPSGTTSGSEQLTGSYDTRYERKGTSIVSSSNQITEFGFINSASIYPFTGSTNARLNSIELTTGSLNTYTGSANSRLNSIELTTGSLNTFTGSINTRFNSIEIKTGSYATTGSNTFIGNQKITGSVDITGSITALTYYNLPTNIVSGSDQLTGSYDLRYHRQGTGLLSGSTQIATEISGAFVSASNSLSGRISVFEGKTLFSSSIQVLYSGISGKPANIVSGSDQISSSYDLKYEIRGNNIISSSVQVKNLLPTGTTSGSEQLTSSYDTRYERKGSGILSSSAQIGPTGIYSGSGYVPFGTIVSASNLKFETTTNVDGLYSSINFDKLYNDVTNDLDAVSGSLTVITGRDISANRAYIRMSGEEHEIWIGGNDLTTGWHVDQIVSPGSIQWDLDSGSQHQMIFQMNSQGLKFTDTRTSPKGIEYSTNITSSIVNNDRSLSDVGTVKLLITGSSNLFTSSYDTFYERKGTGIISSSTQISSDISGSVTSKIEPLNTFSGSTNQRLSRIELTTGSLNIFTGSIQSEVNNLKTATGSYALKTEISGSFISASNSLSGRIGVFEGKTLFSGSNQVNYDQITNKPNVSGSGLHRILISSGSTSSSYSHQNLTYNASQSKFTVTGSTNLNGNLYQTGSTSTRMQFIWDGPKAVGTLPGIEWTNMENQPNTWLGIGGSYSQFSDYVGDFTEITQGRLFTYLGSIAGGVTCSLEVQYSLDLGSSWFPMVTLVVGNAPGYKDSGWQRLPTASMADCYIRLVGWGGDGIRDPKFSPPMAMFR